MEENENKIKRMVERRNLTNTKRNIKYAPLINEEEKHERFVKMLKEKASNLSI